MNKELYRLLLDYKNCGVDDEFIETSFDIRLDAEDTLRDKFVDHMVFNNKIGSIATYCYEEKEITVNSAKVKNYDVINSNANYNDKLFALHILRHEFEHARALKRLYEFRSDIESTVLDYSLREHCIYHGVMNPIIPEAEYYVSEDEKRSYLCEPDERIADIKSWKFVVNLIKNQRRSDDVLYARSMLYCSYIRGYKDNRYYLDPPTYTYLLLNRMFNNYKYLKKRVDSHNYSLDTRMLCGLPITYREYDRVMLRKLGLQRPKNL